MSELLSIFPVLFFVYLLQCIAVAPPGSVVFLLNHRLRGQRLRHSWRVGNYQQYRVYLLNPFWPPAGAVYVDPFPFQIQTDNHGEFLGLSPVLATPEEIPLNLLSFDVPHTIKPVGKIVFIDERPWLSFRSASAALNAVTFLAKLQRAPQGKRTSLVQRELRTIFSVESVSQRLEQYSRSIGFLQGACFSLLLFLFAWSPLLIYFAGLHHVWIVLLLYLVCSSCLILWLFLQSYARLFPGTSEGRLQHTLTVALSPFAAIRANDALLTNLLSGFHPLAVARLILPESEFLEFAGAELRKANFDSRDVVFFQFLAEFLVGQNVDVKLLLGPPLPESFRSLSYCPLCLTQYVIDTGVCRDCGNAPLQAFATKPNDVMSKTYEPTERNRGPNLP
ncbi:MAG: hypothetical protein NVS9B4_20280 [Candidatus Acidiferrum sp.]